MLTSYVHSLYTRTIKAPNDDAFAMLPQDDIDYLTDPDNKADLAGLLYYHLIANPLMSMDIPEGDTRVDTLLEGESILVSKADGVIMINGASMVIDPKNVPACGGGVLHAIDEVLLPSPEPPEPTCKTFVELARDTPGFSTLYDLVVKADLADELSKFDGTVFGKKIVVYLTVSFRVFPITSMLTSYAHSLYSNNKSSK